MLLTIRREQTDKLNIVEIANQFVNNENRLRNFGRFTEKDMRSYAPVESKQKYTQTDFKVESDLWKRCIFNDFTQSLYVFLEFYFF